MDGQAPALFHASHPGEAADSQIARPIQHAPMPDAQSQQAQLPPGQYDGTYNFPVPQPQSEGTQLRSDFQHHPPPQLHQQQPYNPLDPDALAFQQTNSLQVGQLDVQQTFADYQPFTQRTPWYSHMRTEAVHSPGPTASAREAFMLDMLQDILRDIASMKNEMYNMRIENRERSRAAGIQCEDFTWLMMHVAVPVG
ncbi:hypothetical protein MAPG_09484 [Magnaporthiopsis poae ATCC 64411]|uniref:Uncharacterized protein n=1 Tax=Magnaporthiopsis poae (strain ATCC 64411 / 73-15) TaxID=644358 RepID=A0A0C4EA29_MAGP6|nr:hypothetical protein MAPG_09484 [Magnaporthiopsis poae ATCC 64411]